MPLLDVPVQTPSFMEYLNTENSNQLGNDDNFPDAVIMIELGGKYAAVNLTTHGPDPMTVGALVCFATEKEAELWEQVFNLSGARVSKTFDEARALAISKPAVHALALQVAAQTRHIHWVR